MYERKLTRREKEVLVMRNKFMMDISDIKDEWYYVGDSEKDRLDRY